MGTASKRRIRGTGLVAGALVAGTVAAATPGTAGAAEAARCAPGQAAPAYTCARPGDLVAPALEELRPTQAVLGHDEVYYKLGRYRSDKDAAAGGFNKRFDDWCEANGQGEAASVRPDARLDDPSTFTCTVPLGQETEESVEPMKTAVVGPGGQLYLTDGHHTLTSFLESPDGGPRARVRVRVTDNFSDLSPAAFWQRMRAENKVWLRDADGREITVGRLPERLGLASFQDDPYRSLVYFTRDIGYAVPDHAPEFLEYQWGSWLRPELPLAGRDLDDPAAYLALVKDASRRMTALAPDTVVADGRTAAQLGRLAAWNDGKKETGGEFAKLGRPLTDAKPGKLAYALDFKKDVARTPACTTTLTGTHNGPLVVNRGVTCLDRASVRGPVTVRPSAVLVATGARVEGPVRADGAAGVQLCGTSVTGPLAVTGATGPVRAGGPGCTGNRITGPVQLVNNTGPVVFTANEVTGPLTCSGNTTGVDTTPRPNTVRGPATGQCATP
ncbi:ParB/Srx family N-terminal domain-containing protein [Streptomyces termitum]|uniref:ParB/Srx family N-terminal domain-containing protein n=1 Tax=Streptomyces termitum TaxID=67368 RepID=UPI0033B91178